MKEFIEKLIGRLEENGQKMCEAKSSVPYGKHSPANHRYYKAISIKKATHIANQLAEEYNNGWISADVELPTKNGWYWGYYVTSSYTVTDGVKNTECKYASIYWEDNLWLHDPRSFRTVDEVIAWKPIAPYQPKGE